MKTKSFIFVFSLWALIYIFPAEIEQSKDGEQSGATKEPKTKIVIDKDGGNGGGGHQGNHGGGYVDGGWGDGGGYGGGWQGEEYEGGCEGGGYGGGWQGEEYEGGCKGGEGGEGNHKEWGEVGGVTEAGWGRGKKEGAINRKSGKEHESRENLY